MLAVQVILEVVALATPFAFMLVYLYHTLSIMLVVFQSVHSRLLPQVYVINSRWCFFLLRPEKIFISILDNTSFLKELLPLLDNFSLLCYLRGPRYVSWFLWLVYNYFFQQRKKLLESFCFSLSVFFQNGIKTFKRWTTYRYSCRDLAPRPNVKTSLYPLLYKILCNVFALFLPLLEGKSEQNVKLFGFWTQNQSV